MAILQYLRTNLCKVLLSLAPLIWGIFTWTMAWGPLGKIIPYGSFNILVRAILGYGIVVFFFYRALEYARKHYQSTFFNYTMPLPPWWLFIVLNFFAIGVSFFYVPIYHYPLLESIVLGLLLSSCIEEFLAHALFVKYKMHFLEFFFFNIITSLSFTFMHAGYFEQGKSICDLFSMPHFAFSFMLGILVYKTQRIELAIILHILSNVLNYTLPVCILHQSINLSCISQFQNILFYLCLAGCAYKYKEKI